MSDLFGNLEDVKEVESSSTEEQSEESKKEEEKKKGILSRFGKKDKKEKEEKIIKPTNYAAPLGGYDFTPSYIHAIDRFATIVKIYNNFGMNRHLEYGWGTRLIPQLYADGIKAYLIEVDKPLGEQEQRDIMLNNVEKNKVAVSNPDNESKKDTTHDKRVRPMRLHDLNLASALDGQEMPMIDGKLHIMLTAKDPDLIKQQLDVLQSNFSDQMKGVRLISDAGTQQQLLENLFSPPEPDIYNETWMSPQFAGLDHMVRKGLIDDNGWAVGQVTYSMASGQALFDMNGSFDSANDSNRNGNVLVASSDSARVGSYSERYSASSLWSQLIANNVMANGHHVYHLVLNDFNYKPGTRQRTANGTNGMFSAPKALNNVMQFVDLSRGGINPMQMFGRVEDVAAIYNQGLDRITMIFHLLSGRDMDAATRSALRRSLNNFYISRGLWIEDGAKNPERTRILNIEDPNQFPLAGQLIGELINAVTRSKRQDDTEAERDRMTQLERTLRNALDAHGNVFNDITRLPNVPDRKYLQTYYDLGGLQQQENIMEAQFLNAFDYVTAHLQQGDLVVLHGMDRLTIDVVKYIERTINRLKRDKVRFVFSFDTVGGQYVGEKTEETHKLDVFNAHRILYRDFNNSFDYSILGSLTEDEIKPFEHIAGTRLPNNLKRYLTQGGRNQFQIRRPYDGTSNFVLADFII